MSMIHAPSRSTRVAAFVGLAIASAMVWPVAGLEADGRTQGPSPHATDVVAAFLNRQDPPATSYRARRRLEARNERFSKHGWYEVVTELGPGGFNYQIVAKGGSEYVHSKVLQPALDAERDLVKASGGGAFDTNNYRLAADGFEGEFPRIRVTPIRKDKMLVDGWLLVSPRGTDLVQVRGRLAKAPSFWTSQVDVVRRYERIAGIRVPISLESVADVRFAGRSTFQMTYVYETINGVTVPRSTGAAAGR